MDSQVLWGITIWHLILAVLLVLIGFATGPVLRRWIARMPVLADSSAWSGRQPWIGPVSLAALAAFLMAAAELLQLPMEVDMHVGNVLTVILVGALAFFAMRTIRRVRTAGQTLDPRDRRALRHLVRSLQVVILLIAGIFMIDATVFPLAERVGRLLEAEVLWGITVLRLLIGTVLLLLGLWSRPLVRWVLRRTLGSQHLAKGAAWVRDVQELLPYPLSLIAHAALWYVVGQILLFPTEPFDVRLWVTTALLVALVLAVTFLAWRMLDVGSRMASRRTAQTKSRLDDQLIPLVRKAFKITVALVVAVIIVEKMGFSPISLIASLGVGGLALALAAKDTIANLFGSMVIFTDQPFQVGDGIQVGSVEGVVEEVGLRSTRIRAWDRAMATVPNQQFTSTSVVNLSERPNRRIRFEVGIGYDASAADMEAFLEAVRTWLRSREGLNHDSVVVHLTQFADSSLTVLVQVLTEAADLGTSMVLQEEVMLGVMRLVETHGLEVAFPTRTVHIATPSAAIPSDD